MRLIFLGSGDFGLPTLQWLSQHHQVAAVVSQPDRPAGRKRRLTPTPISEWTQQAGLPLHRWENVNEPHVVDQLSSLKADAAIVIAFGQKLSQPLVQRLGRLVVNLHASLLPRYRGAAPINWAMIHGDKQTGLSVIALADRMDAGEIYGQAATLIDPHETAGELEQRLAHMGPNLMAEMLQHFQTGALKPWPQDESQASRAPKLHKSDGHVSFETTAEAIRQRIHGLTPWPGVTVQWHRTENPSHAPTPLLLRRIQDDPGHRHDAAPGTILPDGWVAASQGAVRLLEVQLPGKRPMTLDEFTRGHRLLPGDRLT